MEKSDKNNKERLTEFVALIAMIKEHPKGELIKSLEGWDNLFRYIEAMELAKLNDTLERIAAALEAQNG